jgi:hypothetical protein
MSRSSLINLSLQIVFAGLRYAMMGWVYARSDLAAVGQINALLTFVTAMTFVAGFELHQVVNRSILLGTNDELRWGPDRVVMSALVVGVMAWSADLILFGTNRGTWFTMLVFMVAVTEYLALEFGRLLIAKSRFLVVTVGGFVRSVAPYLAVLVIQPTLEAMLSSWLLGSALVLAMQAVLLWRGAYFVVERRCLSRASYSSAALFFVAGVSMALMPVIERWLAGNLFSAVVLGQYALAIALVSLCDLVMQGGIWQPFIARILQRLAKSSQRRSTVIILLGITLVVYLGAGVLALILSDQLLELINKDPLPSEVLLGVFILGIAKALYSLVFYCYYATGWERALVNIQLGMVTTLVLVMVLGSKTGIDFGISLATAGGACIVLLLVLVFRWINSSGPSAEH